MNEEDLLCVLETKNPVKLDETDVPLLPASSRSYGSLLTPITHRRGESTLPRGVPLLKFLVE